MIEIKTPKDFIKVINTLIHQFQKGDCLTLQGPLGVGKTTFTQQLLRQLDPKIEEVPSPTFTLVQTYDINGNTFWHFDLYRLKDAEEVFEIGFEEALTDGISLIEWPERLGPYLPKDRLEITLEFGEGETHHLDLKGFGSWKNKLKQLSLQ